MSLRTLTSALLTELGKTETAPGFLLYIGTETPLYMSSFGTVSWNGQSWVETDLVIGDIVSTPSGTQFATIGVGNIDYSFGIFALSGSLKGVPMTLYAAYAGAMATADVVNVFDGFIQAPRIDEEWVTLPVTTAKQGSLMFPSKRIGPQIGIGKIRPTGSRIVWNGQVYTLERQ